MDGEGKLRTVEARQQRDYLHVVCDRSLHSERQQQGDDERVRPHHDKDR